MLCKAQMWVEKRPVFQPRLPLFSKFRCNFIDYKSHFLRQKRKSEHQDETGFSRSLILTLSYNPISLPGGWLTFPYYELFNEGTAIGSGTANWCSTMASIFLHLAHSTMRPGKSSSAILRIRLRPAFGSLE